ncbi:MAG: tail fiber domain-containing protein [Nitrosomonadales bacterium]|nr:tail fiber domain-containing protein [Nitrosomonadales bacterium]
MRTLETLKRFKPSRAQLIGGSLILSSGMLALAAVPNSFTSGTTISSTAVNDNFSALDTRTGVLETAVTGGNIVLVPSTATTGNILKGTAPFLHNFGQSNTFLGQDAGNFTMTGTNNTASGRLAFASNTTGTDNSANGLNALRSNTTGNSNTASGVSALFGNTSGANNTASGAFALESASGNSGNNNTASGAFAIRSNTTGSNNTAIGVGALSNNTTGGANIAVGLNAGFGISTGVSNIVIGNAGGAESNTIRIGNTDQTRAFVAGIRGVTTGAADAIAVMVDSNGQLGTVSSSRRVKDDIADMGEASSVLMKLRPVTFHYKADQNPKGRSLQYGLVAEEVEKVAPGLVARSANGEIETVFYQHLAPMLLNEYQKQQRLIETQTAQLNKQADRVAELEKQAQEIVALKQELARMAAVVARLGQPVKVASAGR